MPNTVLLRWTDEGKYKNTKDFVERRFVIEKGDLSVGQTVNVQFTKKKNSRAKEWKAVL